MTRVNSTVVKRMFHSRFTSHAHYIQAVVDVGPYQLPAPQSGTLSRILSGTLPPVQTVSVVCLKRTCSLDTSAFSALDVLDDNRAL